MNVDTGLKTALIQILYASLQPSSICIKFLCASFRPDFTSAEIFSYEELNDTIKLCRMLRRWKLVP